MFFNSIPKAPCSPISDLLGLHLQEKLELVHPLAESYAVKLLSPEDEFQQELALFTTNNRQEHHMLSGHLQGKVLEMISWMIRPERILEIGTFTGYSALCLAKGLSENGKLHTIEYREEDAGIARSYFDKAGLADKVVLHTGNALDIIPGLQEEWDLVFIDADKTGYIDYFNLVLPKVRKNGFILADNIFFHGQVLADGVKGRSAKAVYSFNEYIRTRNDIDKAVITVRDGLYLIRKL